MYLGNTAPGGRNWLIGAGAGTSASPSNFYVYDQTSSAFRLSINSSGFIGIGTTTPSATLEVNGSAVFDNTVSISNTATFAGGAYIGARSWEEHG